MVWYDYVILFGVVGLGGILYYLVRDRDRPIMDYNQKTEKWDLPRFDEETGKVAIESENRKYERWVIYIILFLIDYYYLIFKVGDPVNTFKINIALASMLSFLLPFLPVIIVLFAYVGTKMAKGKGEKIAVIKIKPDLPDEKLLEGGDKDACLIYIRNIFKDDLDGKYKETTGKFRDIINRNFVEFDIKEGLLNKYSGEVDYFGEKDYAKIIYAYYVKRVFRIYEEGVVKMVVKGWEEEGDLITANQLLTTELAKQIHQFSLGELIKDWRKELIQLRIVKNDLIQNIDTYAWELASERLIQKNLLWRLKQKNIKAKDITDTEAGKLILKKLAEKRVEKPEFALGDE